MCRLGAFELRRHQEEAGVALLSSPDLDLPGVVHGFATRKGGVSQGVRASLNFGLKWGDAPANVMENQRRLAEVFGLGAQDLYRQTQVHGRQVQVVQPGDDFHKVARGESDAMVTGGRGIALGVVTADCVPVLLLDPELRAVAAVHAGWRGIVGGVIQATVEVMVSRFGCIPEQLKAASGPCIGPCCYEVGEEVAGQFEDLPGAVDRGAGPETRPHLDLPAAVGHVLDRLSIQASHAGVCTRCDPEHFFSYRRDKEGTGLQMSVIGLV